MPIKTTMKDWRLTMSEILGITPSAVSMRLKRGYYRNKIRIQRENPRVVFVLPHPKTGKLFPNET